MNALARANPDGRMSSALIRGSLRGEGVRPSQQFHCWLLAEAKPRPLAQLLCKSIAESVLGESAMPARLGLGSEQHRDLMSAVFGDANFGDIYRAWLMRHPEFTPALRRAELRAELRGALAAERESEAILIERLLRSHAADDAPLSHLVARIVALGCLGGAHLYRDLGFERRCELRTLLAMCFPSLVAENIADMRWKKFFYRMICQQGGDYVCRSPSCEDCSSRDECFDTSDGARETKEPA